MAPSERRPVLLQVLLIGEKQGDKFVPNLATLNTLVASIDVAKAGASVEADREREMKKIKEGVGVDALNRLVVGAMAGCAYAVDQPAVLAMAFGDDSKLKGLQGEVALRDALMGAAGLGLVEAVRALLARGDEVKGGTKAFANLEKDLRHSTSQKMLFKADMRTALHNACAGGHLECAQLLIESNADVNGGTITHPLALACQNGHEKLARLLFEKGAKMELASTKKTGLGLLFSTCQRGHEGCTRLLLEQGAASQVNQRMPANGGTALNIASERGHVGCVRLLLEHGAQVNLTRNNGAAPLHMACKFGLRGAKAAAVAAHEAAAEKAARAAMVKLLLEHGAQVDLTTDKGCDALLFACELGDEDIARMLLEHGATVNLTNPLYMACQTGQDKCARLLLEHGANVDQANTAGSTGRTPLLHAIRKGHGATVQVLLEGGAQVDLADKTGCTPLCAASEEGDEATVRLLLERGALVEKAMKNPRKGRKLPDGRIIVLRGLTPLMLACRKGHDAVALLLLKHGANPDTPTSNFPVSSLEHDPRLPVTLSGWNTTVRAFVTLGARDPSRMAHATAFEIGALNVKGQTRVETGALAGVQAEMNKSPAPAID